MSTATTTSDAPAGRRRGREKLLDWKLLIGIAVVGAAIVTVAALFLRDRAGRVITADE